MVQPAFEAGANFYIDESLVTCLFGEDGTPGFFGRLDARPISAVVYCNGFTVSKFWRLSSPNLFRTRVRAIRDGVCLIQGDRSGQPRPFRFEVGDPDGPDETWAEGVTVFLNPNADVPLELGVLPASSTITLREDTILRALKGFHPLTSTMIASPRQDR